LLLKNEVDLGKEELSEALEAIHHESHKLRKLFKEALRVVNTCGV
jgi:hypothetical protein